MDDAGNVAPATAMSVLIVVTNIVVRLYMNGERKHFVTELHNGKKISKKGDGQNEN